MRLGTRTSSISEGRAGCAGRGALLLFGLVFFSMGAVFVGLIVRETWANWRTRSWPPMPCTIVESQVQTRSEGSDPYRPVVRYRLQDGSERVYETWKRNTPGFDDYARAQEVVERYPAGSTTTAHVDPADPSQAVLEHASMWIGLFVFLPLIFVLIGLVVMVSAVRGGARTETSAKPQALSEKARLGRRTGVLLFALFLVIGLAVFVPVGVMPMLRLIEARDWPAVQCTVISSRVRDVRGDDGTTYKPEILYAYTYIGREYRSSRYSAHAWSSGDRSKASAIVARYPPGSTTTCYVNPARPGEALLTREIDWLPVLLSMIPLVFVVIGAVGVTFMLRQGRGTSGIQPISAAAARGPLAPLTSGRRGPIVLRPNVRPLMKVVALGIFALVWNGIISVFVYQVIKGWNDGQPDMCLTAFMIPFVLVGLGVIAGMIHAFLAAFNPLPELAIEKSALSPGDSAEMKWHFTGNVQRIHRLRITLEGREEATYRRGTDTVTDKHVFHRATIVETSRPMEISTGKGRLSIPAETMHSFSSSSNKVVWELCLHGEIESWPDVKQEFALDVEPLPLSGGRA